jgi:hypothetical protein
MAAPQKQARKQSVLLYMSIPTGLAIQLIFNAVAPMRI